MLRFAGFELDRERLELRRTGGAVITLRPKTFDVLSLLATRPGQLVLKQELMTAIWPNVHVGEDSLFQCIRELRLALGDGQRQLIKVVSGRGYRLDADVVDTEREAASALDAAENAIPPATEGRRRLTILATIGLAVVALAIATPVLIRALFPPTPTLAILPLSGTGNMPAEVTGRLIDGLAAIPNFEVTAPSSAPGNTDFVLAGAVQQSNGAWTAQARLTRGTSNEVVWTGSFSLAAGATPDLELQQSRLAAALGHDLSVRLNALFNADDAAASGPSADAGKVVVEQANAYINQQNPERFHAAQAMLEDGIARYPGNTDIEVALAAQLMRGVQMVFYSPDESIKARARARSILEGALEARPNGVPVHEAYCRFLTTTNQFRDALVACARTLTFDPWNGIALYHLGLAELNLGRFDDALRTFLLANSYDTPEVSRWTWRLGAGWSYMLMGRAADAVPWLEGTIAITPASGRVYLLLAAAYQSLGRLDEAAAAMQQCLELRPGSTAANVGVPMENTSPLFAAASEKLIQLGVAAGLPAQ
jgi:DNA-binding winged helix-turn-helix (wHTH) protein/tetratricopeptide (TPR) repeat protein